MNNQNKNHEQKIFDLLDRWEAQQMSSDLDEKILSHWSKKNKQTGFSWAWAAMIIVIVVNIFVFTRLVNETKEYSSTLYTEYIQSAREDLTNE